MPVLALVVVLAGPSPITALRSRNAAADAVPALARSLGIDFGREDQEAEHPTRESLRALKRAGAGAWVDAVIQTDSDQVPEPPAPLREFLASRRESVWSVIAALEKDSPDWGPELISDGRILIPMLPILRLERVLVAAALVEEREGNRIDAGRALEAAWSLSQSLPTRKGLITELVAIGAEKMQVGAVRKMQAPPLPWLGRLASEGPWPRMLEALPKEGRFRPPGLDDGSRGASSEVAVKALTAIADALSKVSPCDLAGMSDDEIWRPAKGKLAAETGAFKRAFRDFYAENMVESVAGALRRAARLEVDREVTLRIVQLRLERDASRDGHGPGKAPDATSAACPMSAYAYEATPSGIELRFEGAIDVPKGMGPILPLRFVVRSSEPTPIPVTPLTPPAAGGMMPPP